MQNETLLDFLNLPDDYPLLDPSDDLSLWLATPFSLDQPLDSTPNSTEKQPPIKTKEYIEKRKRNTAASAKFRAKKKLKEQLVSQTAKELTDKVDLLERTVKEQALEIKWLKGLLTEKNNSNPYAHIAGGFPLMGNGQF